MGLTIKKLLKYFTPDELKDALFNINEPRSGTRGELENRILAEWEEHNRTWFDLLAFLPDDVLATICDDYNENSDGIRSTLIRRIVKLLESSKPINNSPPTKPQSSDSLSAEGSSYIRKKTDGVNQYPKKRLIIAIVAALVAITTIAANFATIVSMIEGNSQNKATVVMMPNETQSSKGVAKIYFYDNTPYGKILLNLDFFKPNPDYVTYDKILMLGALPTDGVINVKLSSQYYKQYNESMFILRDMSMDAIKPIPVSSGKLNMSVPINLYPRYSSSNNYQNMNDTQWYEVPVGNATFRFDYIDTNNDNQSFFFTQPLSVKVKGCQDNENKPIPCK